MSYFSRLTDIVSCDLTQLLAQAEDPEAALAQILREMEEGLAGAKRCTATAAASVDRLTQAISDHRDHMASWADRARDHLLGHRENDARQCLLRKREVEDLLAGLQQQLQAAIATREQLSTTLRALEARWNEARRRQAELSPGAVTALAAIDSVATIATADERLVQVDAELEALKRELAG